MCQESFAAGPTGGLHQPFQQTGAPEIDACFSISEVDCIQTNQE